METKAILATFYIILGIYSMIVYLRYGYKKYEVLTVADIEVDIITEKLKPYHVSVSIVGFY